MNPLVTVCIGCYNEVRYIEKTLNSLMEQSLGDFKVLISDNKSTDGTAEVIEESIREDERFQLIRQERNIGAAQNWQYLLNAADNKYIMFLGAHDFISPNFLGSCLSEIEKKPEISISFAPPIAVNEAGEF